MGCMHVCKDPVNQVQYSYTHQLKFIKETISQIICFKKNFYHQFVTKCYQQMCHTPSLFILKYPKKIQDRQSVPVNILQKWKLILYGSGYQHETYITCLGSNNANIQEDKLKQERTFKAFKQNPFQINLSQLYYHDSYRQIQKDIIRKYQIPQLKQQSFERILKKISNYFPSTGYALGINYIVGYFLIIGYSQIDSFWLFVHLALNKRFMALGLFQQGFPLAKILILIFKNMLKRINRQVYEFIFQKIWLDDSMWLLKWFMSFYLSSFPIEACQYIWDLVLGVGILGLVYFGLSLLQTLSKKILNCQDEGDFILFLKSLSEIQTFNEQIQMEKVMSFSYSLSIDSEDLQGLQQLNNSFYVQYFSTFKSPIKTKDSKIIQKQNLQLTEFYQQILTNRQQFTNLARQSATKFFQPPTNQRNITSPLKSSQIHKSSQKRCQLQQFDQQQEQQQTKQKQLIQNIRTKRHRSLDIHAQEYLEQLPKNRSLNNVCDIQAKYLQKNVVNQAFQDKGLQKNYVHFKQNSQQSIKTIFQQQKPESLSQDWIKMQKNNRSEGNKQKQFQNQLNNVTSFIRVKSVGCLSSKSKQWRQQQSSQNGQKIKYNQIVKQISRNIQIAENQNGNSNIQKQELQSVPGQFLNSQLNQVQQSQWHISIYNIQQSKIRRLSQQKLHLDQNINNIEQNNSEQVIQNNSEQVIQNNSQKVNQQRRCLQKLKQNQQSEEMQKKESSLDLHKSRIQQTNKNINCHDIVEQRKRMQIINHKNDENIFCEKTELQVKQNQQQNIQKQKINLLNQQQKLSTIQNVARSSNN